MPVDGLLAKPDPILGDQLPKQLQIATTVLNANAKKNGAQTLLAEQVSPANPGPGVGGNLDVTA